MRDPASTAGDDDFSFDAPQMGVITLDGETSGTLTLTATDDDLVEGDESLTLNGIVGDTPAAGSVTLTIEDDDGDEPARFDQVTTGRAAIFTGGWPVHLPHHRAGWRWEPYAVDGADIDAARQ